MLSTRSQRRQRKRSIEKVKEELQHGESGLLQAVEFVRVKMQWKEFVHAAPLWATYT